MRGRAAIGVMFCCSLVLAGCATMRPDTAKRETHALPPATDTPSSRYIGAELRSHAGESGFRLLTKSNDALMSRLALADHAAHSIDLQYFIFKNDETGRLLAQRLLAAADRGVRVRILLDDINITDQDRLLDALDAHKNIEIRLFNPYRTRSPSTLSKVGQFLVDGPRLNRRMHNKSFIADNVAAIVGGRNIGDDYFDASRDTNFRDLDLIVIGPAVEQASAVFDTYWNCDAAYRVRALGRSKDAKAELEKLRDALEHHARHFEQTDYAKQVLEELPQGATADRWGEWFWGSAQTVADDPQKVEAQTDDPALRIGPRIKAMIDGAQHDVLMTTPYLVPGKTGTAFLAATAKRGVAVKILTNSLASTDETAAHAGYAHYRADMLAGGVTLYELRPGPGGEPPASAAGTSSGVSLHAKSVVVDEKTVFIGSLNIDQRSKSYNTEMGVIVDSPKLAQAVAHFFAEATAPDAAFQVSLTQPGDAASALVWRWSDDGKAQTTDAEPGVSAARRAEVTMLKLLPIEGLL